MRKTWFYAALLVFVLLLSSCGKNNSNSPASSPSASPTSSSSSSPTSSPTASASAPASSTASPSASNSSSETSSYLGTWTVHSIAGSTPVSAGADKSLIGMKAVYGKDKASFGKDKIQNPDYKVKELTGDEFYTEFKTQLSDIGIKSESVMTVSVSNWSNAGNLIIVKDDDTLIFLWDGTYYEMKREKQ